MNFALTDDQAMIRDAAQGFLAQQSDSAAVRRAMAGDAGWDAQVWARIGAELGWCGIPLPEAHGGLGLGPVELALVLEQMGRYLLCAPYFSTVCLAANLLSQAGSENAQARLLPRLAEGTERASAPLPSTVEGWVAAANRVQAWHSGKSWKLGGGCDRVPDGYTADWLLLPATVEGETQPALFVVPRNAPGVTAQLLEGWDATRRFAGVELEGVVLPEDARVDDPARIADGLVRAAALVRLAIAAEQLGGAQQCLDLTVEYTAGRKQFGRAVASFQAVKHRCAEMMVRIEAARSAVYGAAAFAAGEVATAAMALECVAARALASDTFFFCAQEAIQLHGGVGFTWEYDPQLYFKRAQASSHWLGSADALREHIAQALIG
jgi:alkylation response protein AidB-like acyl-CoA dehydrogenase